VPRVEPPVDGSAASILQRFVLTLDKCQLVIHRACFEMEPEPLPLLADIFGRPVIPYGLVPPCPPAEGHGEEHGNAALSWLDKQQPGTVLYIALGSEPPVTVEQLHEIALGLELAGAPFLWALKKPNGLLLEAADGDILPPGFEERTRDRGLVAMGWVPQPIILAHSSVGAFLTHGGWASTIEGVMAGHPMLFLTFLDEQMINAQLIERKKAGLRVPRHDKDGSFDRQGVAGAIRAVMCEEERKSVFAANAKKMQEIVGDRKCHERYIDELIQRLRSFKK
jgi:UDP:flavonoid glycosyltransferase YjiC (YdhE family)